VFIISFLHGKSKKISKLDTFLSEIRNEYLLESVQIVLFRIGAKTIIFRKLSARSAPIICIFCNDLSRFLARAPHLRQHPQQLGMLAKIIYRKSAQIRAIRGDSPTK
jgi:hypothetical protein